jgi:hypothetical protein
VNEDDALRAAIAVTFWTWGALIVVALALPDGWAPMVFPNVLAAPLLGAEAFRSARRNGGAR